jgi:uncharacterized protein YecA (UPF0149 family)
MFVDLDFRIKQSTLSKIFRMQLSPEYIAAVNEEMQAMRDDSTAGDDEQPEEALHLLDQLRRQQEQMQKNMKINRGEDTSRTPVKSADSKVGRNDLCPCGSGKKYKKCCGR